MGHYPLLCNGMRLIIPASREELRLDKFAAGVCFGGHRINWLAV